MLINKLRITIWIYVYKNTNNTLIIHIQLFNQYIFMSMVILPSIESSCGVLTAKY